MNANMWKRILYQRSRMAGAPDRPVGSLGQSQRDFETYQSPETAARLQTAQTTPSAAAGAPPPAPMQAGPSFGDRLGMAGQGLARQGFGMMSDERSKSAELDSLRRRYSALGGRRA